MAKKIIISLISLLMLTFFSIKIYGQQADSCANFIKTEKDAAALLACLDNNLQKKRKKLIDDFRSARQGVGVSRSAPRNDYPTPSLQSPESQSPRTITPVQPVVNPSQPQTAPRGPQIHYNY